jgi:predicted N-acyltransferase
VNRTDCHHSIEDLGAAQWNALGAGDNPFTRYEFLAALEHARCVGRGSGWEPRYLTLRDAHGPAAGAAAFVKTHSFGEFVFDFAWARGYERLGRRYYPKLTLAAPFTPATAGAAGSRLAGARRPAARRARALLHEPQPVRSSRPVPR